MLFVISGDNIFRRRKDTGKTKVFQAKTGKLENWGPIGKNIK